VTTANPSPLFIVGSPRSGTSALVGALRAAGYRGFNEGNFFGLLANFHLTIDNYFRSFGTDDPFVMMSRIDRQELKTGVAELIRKIVDRENPVAPWMDKSGNPDVITMIPALVTQWPTAHFLFAKRRGLENITSRLKKFPNYSFEYHCRDWAANMAAWRAVRQELPDLRCLEMDQQSLIKTPIAAGRQIAAFLNLSVQQQTRLINTFRKDRPQQTSAGSSERVLSLQSTGWSAQHKDIFMRLCGHEMQYYDYSLDETYRRTPAEPPAEPPADEAAAD
jgi:hypothetical protein